MLFALLLNDAYRLAVVRVKPVLATLLLPHCPLLHTQRTSLSVKLTGLSLLHRHGSLRHLSPSL